jgi:hypothetical protein
MHPARLVGRPVEEQSRIRRPEGVLTPNIQSNNKVPSCPGAAHRGTPVGGLDPPHLQ